MPKDPIPTLKEQLRKEILSAIEPWPQAVAAKVIGVDPPRVSDLVRGRLERFSLEKLICLLAAVDRRVDIRVVDTTGGVRRGFARRVTT